MIKVRCRDTFASDDINRGKETSTNESHFCDFDPESHRLEIKIDCCLYKFVIQGAQPITVDKVQKC